MVFMLRKPTAHVMKLVVVAWAVLSAGAAGAATLQGLQFAELPGNSFEVRMDFDELPPEDPTGYSIEQPARIVLDFPSVANGLSERKFPLSFENASSAVVLGTPDRTRIILNLVNLEAFTTRREGNSLLVEVGGGSTERSIVQKPSSGHAFSEEREIASNSRVAVTNIDFRRGEDGEGKVIVELSDPFCEYRY